MNRLDCSSAEVKAALEEVSSPTGANEWYVLKRVFLVKFLRVLPLEGLATAKHEL